MKISRLLWTAFSCTIILNALPSFADDKYWVCGSDSWDQSSCWNPAGQPTTDDNAFLTQSDGTDRVVTYINAISPTQDLWYSDLTVDATGSGSMTFSQSQDNFLASEGIWYVGYDGTGIFNQTGGNSHVLGLLLGYNSTANGTFNISDGYFYTEGHLILGAGENLNQSGGVGTVNQMGGTVDPGNGLDVISSGSTYNLFEGNLEAVSAYINVRDGTFNQFGGEIYQASSGINIGVNGVYNMSDGFLSEGPYVDIPTIRGTFNQSGGIHNIYGDREAHISGTYNLTGGLYSAWRYVTLVMDSGGTFNFNGGNLSVANFTGDLANNGGTLAPGWVVNLNPVNNSFANASPYPGTTNITGNYSQSIDSVYAVQIGGTASGEFDVLDVAGVATLGGRLDVSLFDLGGGEFSPSLGDSFDILLAETISGEFDYYSLPTLGEGLGWDVSYLADEIGSTDIVRLSVEAVPIPPSVWLFGSGLLGLVGIARRNKAA